MGWKDDLQDASFRGVQFECTSTNDSASKSLAIKQAPYSNKASIEDMGNDPRKISIEAIYTGTDYKIWLDALEAALLATGSGELIHPVYGVMNVNVVNYSVGHVAEDVDFCKISIEFVQAEDKERPLFIPISTPDEIDIAGITASPVSALQSLLEKLEQLNPNKNFAFINELRDNINTARRFLNATKTAVENVLSPDWVTGLIDDATRLATFDPRISAVAEWREQFGRIERLVQRNAQRASGASSTTAISKWRDVFKRVQQFEKLYQNENSPKILKQTWRAVQAAIAIAVTQQVVTTVRNEMSVNKTISFTPVELAVIRQQVRKLLQQAINTERAQIAMLSNLSNIYVEDDVVASELIFVSIAQIQIYKQFADLIHLQFQELIEVRPPITTTTILVPCTLHWLAHALYGDMDRADEIRRLNPDLQNPAILRIGMELTIYAR